MRVDLRSEDLSSQLRIGFGREPFLASHSLRNSARRWSTYVLASSKLPKTRRPLITLHGRHAAILRPFRNHRAASIQRTPIRALSPLSTAAASAYEEALILLLPYLVFGFLQHFLFLARQPEHVDPLPALEVLH